MHNYLNTHKHNSEPSSPSPEPKDSGRINNHYNYESRSKEEDVAQNHAVQITQIDAIDSLRKRKISDPNMPRDQRK